MNNTETSMSNTVREMLIAAGVDTTEIDNYTPTVIQENSKYKYLYFLHNTFTPRTRYLAEKVVEINL